MTWMSAHRRAKLAAEAERRRLRDRARLEEALRPYAKAVASIRTRPLRVPAEQKKAG
jgi:hypothetical protein